MKQEQGKEYPLLFAENFFESNADKARLFELCFEKFNAPQVCLCLCLSLML